jgi:CRISPR-associated endonuclease Cas3-HD
LLVTKEKAMLIKLWAKKLSSQGMADPSFHPLLCHMLDVACVTECIWQSALERGFRKKISAKLNLKEEHAGKCLAFWAGLHDLGKANTAFQGKCQEGRERHDPKIRKRELPSPPLSLGTFTAPFEPALLTERFPGFPRSPTDGVGRAVGGHHGHFPRDSNLRGINKNQCAGGKGEVIAASVSKIRRTIHLGADALIGDPGLMGNLSKSRSQIGIDHLENKDGR